MDSSRGRPAPPRRWRPDAVAGSNRSHRSCCSATIHRSSGTTQKCCFAGAFPHKRVSARGRASRHPVAGTSARTSSTARKNRRPKNHCPSPRTMLTDRLGLHDARMPRAVADVHDCGRRGRGFAVLRNATYTRDACAASSAWFPVADPASTKRGFARRLPFFPCAVPMTKAGSPTTTCISVTGVFRSSMSRARVTSRCRTRTARSG